MNSQDKNLIAETYTVDNSSTRMNNPYMPTQGMPQPNSMMQYNAQPNPQPYAPSYTQTNAQPYAQPYTQPYTQPYAQPYAQPQTQPYVPQQQSFIPVPTTTTTIINTGAGFSRPTWRTHQNVMCSNCHTSMVTNVEYTPGAGTVIVCLFLGVCVGVFAFIACCLDDCKDCEHYCSRCGAHVGTIRYLFDD